MSSGVLGRYCGRDFPPAELEQIRELLRLQPALNRVQLSRRICQDLGWLNPAGQLKAMSCRVALLRMERDGLIRLPKPLQGNGNGRTRPSLSGASEAQAPLSAPLALLEPLRFQNVQKGADSRLWNELIQRYHYLGYTPLSGAQLRYLVWSGSGRVLAALGFGASAWHLKPRDQYLGWSD